MPRSESTASRPIISMLPLVALLLLPGCGAIGDLFGEEGPTASIRGVEVQDLSLDGLTLRFEVEVRNPYAVGLPVAKLDYSVATGGEPFLTGAATDQGVIPADGSRTLPITARVGFLDLIRSVSSIKPGRTVSYAAEIGVSVDTSVLGRLRLPVKTKGSFPVPTVPSVNLVTLEWRSLSRSEASAVMVLEIGNRNDFSFNLDGLAYDLSLGGAKIITGEVSDVIEVESGRTSEIRIPISFKPSSLGIAAFRILSGSGSSWSMDGKVGLMTHWGRLRMPFQNKGDTTFTQ